MTLSGMQVPSWLSSIPECNTTKLKRNLTLILLAAVIFIPCGNKDYMESYDGTIWHASAITAVKHTRKKNTKKSKRSLRLILIFGMQYQLYPYSEARVEVNSSL